MYHNAHGQAHSASQTRDPIIVVAVPAVTLVGSRLVVGDSSSTSTRSYTPLKVVGDGSFGTVWLCDWHGLLPPNTPLSPMQCGAGARPEWAGKRLVAVKRMKKRWEGGWDECRKLKELEALRAVPPHPNVIPLYDFFLLPSSKELYFVFESMEGNLYQLIKSRKSRPLAGGLVASIFRQVIHGLHHIHSSGYFHRDMKPENLLVTTTGLADYLPVSPIAPPNAPPEKDVVVIIKLADFGLARETSSKPPYTEYVSTRWYRAPEVLLHSRDYSNPVDLWALGTIMIELVNLRPLFPGQGEIDQVIRICQCLGDPSDEYGTDNRGRSVGGGPWARGVKLASKVGFTFPKHTPISFPSLFEPTIPHSLIELISDLLKYDPDHRLTTKQCVEHRYFRETAFSQPQSVPVQLTISTSQLTPPSSSLHVNRTGKSPTITSVSPRSIPPSHSQPVPYPNGKLHLNGSAHPLHQHIPDPSVPHRLPFYQRPVDEQVPPSIVIPSQQTANSPTANGDMDGVESNSSEIHMSPYAHPSGVSSNWMQQSPQDGIWENPIGYQNEAQGMHIHETPVVRLQPDDPSIDHDMSGDNHMNGSGKGGKFALGSKRRGWGFGGMFGSHEKMAPPPLPTVEEMGLTSSSSTPSLKRTQSGSTDSHSLPDLSPTNGQTPQVVVSNVDQKKIKKEAARMAREAEKQRRINAEKAHREQARAVMLKNTQTYKTHGDFTMAEVDWPTRVRPVAPAPVPRSEAPINGSTYSADTTQWAEEERRRLSDQLDHRHKARRRDRDDDHSMSSTDIQSSRMSMISFASVDSDPGPKSTRHRPSPYNQTISRATSYSSLRALSPSNRSSTSVEGQLVHDFSNAHLGSFGTASPPPMQRLSLSSNGQWPDVGHVTYITQHHNGNGMNNGSGNLHLPPVSSFDNLQQLQVPDQSSPYEMGNGGDDVNTNGINPMFQVPHPSQQSKLSQSLPPFSHLEAVAEQHNESSLLPSMSHHTRNVPTDPEPPG